MESPTRDGSNLSEPEEVVDRPLPPGPVGRGVRIGAGLALLGVGFRILGSEVLGSPARRELITWSPPQEAWWWMAVAVLLLLFPYLLGADARPILRRLPQILFLLGLALTSVASMFRFGRPWSPWAGLYLASWMLAVSLSLGGGFLLAGLLGVAGREMDAYRPLFARLTKRSDEGTRRPALLEGLDRWEAGRNGKNPSSSDRR